MLFLIIINLGFFLYYFKVMKLFFNFIFFLIMKNNMKILICVLCVCFFLFYYLNFKVVIFILLKGF